MFTPIKTISCAALVFALSGSISAMAQAQAAPRPKAVDRSPAETEWQSLQQSAVDLNRENTSAARQRGAKAGPSERTAKATKLADQAREFYLKNPGHTKAIEAKRLEVYNLVSCVESGDTSVEQRTKNTVRNLRGDPTVPKAVRVELAGTYDFSLAMRRTQPDQLTIAFEQVARGLIAEFPDQPPGYESLLTIAGERDERHGRALALELLAMPAPAYVKQGAQALIDQLSLLGRSLDQVLRDAGADTLRQALQAGKPTLIYAWAVGDPNSVVLGELLATRKLAGVNLIAINLDRDVSTARQTAADHHLPGLLQFDPRGQNGSLADALKLTGSTRLYLTDAQGKISDLRGMTNLGAKLEQLGL